MTNTNPSAVDTPKNQNPLTEGNGWAWLRDWPKRPGQIKPDQNYFMIDPAVLRAVLAGVDESTRKDIMADVDFADKEILETFRERDAEAKKQQNTYRILQLLVMSIAFLSTVLGGLQLLATTDAEHPALLTVLSATEGLVVLITVIIVFPFADRNTVMSSWVHNRQRAEALRQEYFRFVTHQEPYDLVPEFTDRQDLLGDRIAQILLDQPIVVNAVQTTSGGPNS